MSLLETKSNNHSMVIGLLSVTTENELVSLSYDSKIVFLERFWSLKQSTVKCELHSNSMLKLLYQIYIVNITVLSNCGKNIVIVRNMTVHDMMP